MGAALNVPAGLLGRLGGGTGGGLGRPLGGETRLPDLIADTAVPAAVAAAVVNQARAATEPGVDEDGVAQDGVVLSELERRQLIGRHRVGPLVDRGWPEAASAERMRVLTMNQLRLEAAGREVVALLAADGIDSRVLKGLATAALDYPDPTLRHTGDVDILVAPADLHRAVALLAPGRRRRELVSTKASVMQGATFTNDRGDDLDGIEIDLHFRLSRYHPVPPPGLLFERGVRFADGRLTALPPEARLIHAASHAVLTESAGRRLSSVADLVLLVDRAASDRGATPSLDWARAREMAEQLGLAGIVGAALRAEAALMGRGDHPGLAWPEPSRLEQRAFIAPGRHPLATHAQALRHLETTADRVAYVDGWLRPSTAVATTRGGRLGYARHLVRRLLTAQRDRS